MPSPANWFMLELSVQRLDPCLAWYRDVLGWTMVLHSPAERYALLQDGAGRIAMKERPTTASSGRTLDRLVFEVADLNGMMAHLKALGVPLAKPPETSAEGYRRILIADPEGRPVCFFQWQSKP